MVSSITEFNGKKILELKETEEDPYPLKFGTRKAKMILNHAEDIKKFVEIC